MNKATLKVRAASWLAALWIRSLRIRLRTPADFGPGVLGLWHQDLLASTAAFKDRGVHVWSPNPTTGLSSPKPHDVPATKSPEAPTPEAPPTCGTYWIP